MNRNFLTTLLSTSLIVIMAVPLGALSDTGADITADTGSVRIMVALEDGSRDLDIEEREVLREALREVRQISRLAPRRYRSGDGEEEAGDLRRWRVAEVAAEDAAQVLSDLQANPAVSEAYIERVYEAAVVPNDPLFSDQYGLASASNALADINAPAAWERTRGSSGTVIAILDGGVDLGHEDLAGKLWRNGGETAGNGIDDDGNGYVDDVHGWDFTVRGGLPAGVNMHKHATHVAGIAAADSNNGIGVSGVDWEAKIMSVRVLNNAGLGGEEGMIGGIAYAVANGADIINMSIAGPPSPAIREAVENAYAAGVVVVAAAGNAGRDTGLLRPYPACAESNGVNMVLGVGATDDDGEPARFSNYGSCVDVSAPGYRILSTVLRGRYGSMSGTSMSAPMAAGVAGLYLAQNGGASPAAVISALAGSGDPFAGRRAEDWSTRYKGRLNAARVVGAPFTEELPTPLPSPQNPGSSPAPAAGQMALSVEKNGPAEARPGERVTYTITVRNNGTGAAANVRVEDRFHRDLAFAGGDRCSYSRREVTCSGGDLAAGASTTFSLHFDIPADVRCSTRLRDQATVYADDGGRSRRQARSERVTTMVACN